MSLILAVLSAVLVSVECQTWTDTRVVQIDQGPVRGFKFEGNNFFSYMNIPYASVTYRFQVDGPPPTWNETFNAVDRRIICPQPADSFVDVTDLIMLEDCLVINIFVPDTDLTNLPVLVDIHGGAYHSGYGNIHSYTKFGASKNVVTVTFNHRIGYFGFLCLGTKNIPGNAGMKDIIVALRWVQRNIANFGGNPDDVTLSGCSSGGAALDLVLLSKASQGLFKRALPDSGSSLAPFAVLQDPTEHAKNFARSLNFHDVDNIEALEDFFLNSPMEIFISMTPQQQRDTTLEYAACVERDVGQELIFLDDAPHNILTSGNYTKYPTLYGVTDAEGYYNLLSFDQWIAEMNVTFENHLPADLKFDNETQRLEVADRVRRFYFGDAPLNSDSRVEFLDYYSDAVFTYSVLRTVKMHVEAGHDQVYLYEYTYFQEDSEIQGAIHCYQTWAVRDEDEHSMPEEYRRIKAFMRDIWYNFISASSPVVDGMPVPSWPPLNTTDRSPHLSVDREVELRGAMLEEKANFWDAIYKQHYNTPIPPTLPDVGTDGASSVAFNCVVVISLSLIVSLF